MTFIQPNLTKLKSKPKVIKKRQYSKTNLDSFKRDLHQASWEDVTITEDVNLCYEKFWKIFDNLHERNYNNYC